MCNVNNHEGGKIIPLHNREEVKVFHGFKGDENLMVQEFYKVILHFIGEDTNREGLLETPKRHLKFLQEFVTPREFDFTTFKNEGGNDMIIQSGIPFYSLCEHHILPFFGEATVAYLPGERIVGLSKLARCVDYYARRLQNQERIASQVAERLQKELKAKGVAVILKARHMCMEMRGVQKCGAVTSLPAFTGEFQFESVQNKFFQRLSA